jgi:hypothetical protein
MLELRKHLERIAPTEDLVRGAERALAAKATASWKKVSCRFAQQRIATDLHAG